MQSTPFEPLPAQQWVVLSFPELNRAVEEPAACEAESEATALSAEADRECEWEEKLSSAAQEASEEARSQAEAHFRAALEVERSAVALACTSFSMARDRYFAAIEAEVVKLALAIAARILQREIKMDPLLLMGVVRVALGQLNEPEAAVLHVPARDADLWSRAVKATMLRVQPDPALASGEVELRSHAGVARLGVEAQLEEVERGFFDLLAKRPA